MDRGRLVKRGPLVPHTNSPTHAAKKMRAPGDTLPSQASSQRLSALAKPRHPPPPPPTSSSSSSSSSSASAYNPHYLRKLSAPPPEAAAPSYHGGVMSKAKSSSRSRPSSSSSAAAAAAASSAASMGVFDKHVSVVLTATVTEANALAQAGALDAGLRLLSSLPDTLPSVRSKGLFWVAFARLQERQGRGGRAAHTLAAGINACRQSPPAEQEVVVQALLGLALKGAGEDEEDEEDEVERGEALKEMEAEMKAVANENAGGLGGAGAPPRLASFFLSSPTPFDTQSQNMPPSVYQAPGISSVSSSSSSSSFNINVTTSNSPSLLTASTDAPSAASAAATAATDSLGPRPSLPNLALTAFPGAPQPMSSAPRVFKSDLPSPSPNALQPASSGTGSGSGSGSDLGSSTGAAVPSSSSSSLSSSSSNPFAFSGMYADLGASTLGASGIRFAGMTQEAALQIPPPPQPQPHKIGGGQSDTLPTTPVAPGLQMGIAASFGALSPLPSSPTPITLASLQGPPPAAITTALLPPAAGEEGVEEAVKEDMEEEEEEEVLEEDLELDSSSRCPPVFPIPVPVQMGSVVVLQTITARPSTAAALGGAPVFLSPVRRSVRAVRSALKADALNRLGGGGGGGGGEGGKKGKAVSASEVKPKGSKPLTISSSAPLVLAVSHPILREAMKAALNPSASSSSSSSCSASNSQGGRSVVFSPRGSRPVAGGRQDAALSSLTSASDAFAAAQCGVGEGVSSSSSSSSSSSEGTLNAAGLAPPPFLGVSSSDRAALMALSPSSAPLEAISDMLSAAVAPVGTNTIEEGGFAFVPNPALPGVSLLRGHADAEEGEGGGMM